MDACDVSRFLEGRDRGDGLLCLLVQQGERAQWLDQFFRRGSALSAQVGNLLEELLLAIVRCGLGLRE